MKITPYLNFPGTCSDALDFYQTELGAKIEAKFTFAQIPPDSGAPGLPPGVSPNHILNSRFLIVETLVMASDGPPDHVLPMKSAYLCLHVHGNEEAERIYAALSDGGEVFMPLAETFFAHRFAQLRDRFGINWMVIHEKPMGPQ